MPNRFAPIRILLIISICLAGLASTAQAENLPGPVRLLVPPIIPAIVGQECNLYFDNVSLVINPDNWVFDVDSPKGSQQTERWSWIPAPADVGDHPLLLQVLNQENQVVASARSVVRVVAADQNAGKVLSLLCIGDSLTHASQYTQHLLDLSAQPGNPQIQLIGSHGIGEPNPNRHEGYGGWTARRFATHFTGKARTGPYAERGSPFLYPDSAGKPQLDFTHYCQDLNQGRFPDVVTIFLGPNDIFHYNDQTIEGGIDDMLQNLDLLIGMIHRDNEVTKIGLMLAVPPSATQDAFGANYGSGNTRWQYKRNQHRLLERMVEKYSGREAQRLSLIPTHINLDCLHNYPMASLPPNANSETIITRLNNGVHPAKSGYHQIADTLFAWLKGL